MKHVGLLYDQLLTSPHIRHTMKDELRECTIIDVTNVSDYYYRQSDDNGAWKVGDFPNLAPPFDHFFLEFRAPDHWTDNDKAIRWGLLCRGFELDPLYRTTQFQTIAQGKAETDSARIFLSRIAESGRWELSFVLFMQSNIPQIQHIYGPFCRWELFIGKDGQPISAPGQNLSMFMMPIAAIRSNKLVTFEDMDASREAQSEARENYGESLWPGLLAISFMHCKNVSLNQVVPDAIKPTLKQEKLYGMKPRQPATYHVLDIEPMKQVLRTEGKTEHVGIQRSLHICRGHFAHYDEEHKLFGKYAGTYWKPQHVRGTAKAGVTTKDYRIKKVGAI